jgi:hypothetical protein
MWAMIGAQLLIEGVRVAIHRLLRTEPNPLLPNARIYVSEAPWQWIIGQSGGTISRTAPGVAS